MVANEDTSRFNRRPPTTSRRITRRNIFSASLRESLNEALYLTERRYRDAHMSKTRLDEKFQKAIILDLIDLLIAEFRICMFATGSATISQLRQAKWICADEE